MTITLLATLSLASAGLALLATWHAVNSGAVKHGRRSVWTFVALGAALVCALASLELADLMGLPAPDLFTSQPRFPR